MDLKKFETVNDITSEEEFTANPGKTAGIFLIVTATNDSGQTATNEDIGRIEIERKGNPIVNRSFNHFQDMNDIRGGTPIFNSSQAGAVEATCFIPFFEKGHPNALHIMDSEELVIRFIPADDGTVFASGKIEFQQGLSALPERYVMKIAGKDFNESAAVSAEEYNLNQRNVSSLYVEDVDDIIDRFAYESNDRNVVTPNTYLALRAQTLLNNQIEDDTFDIVEIENHTPGVPGSTVNKNNKYVVDTSGAGTFDVTYCSLVWPGK